MDLDNLDGLIGRGNELRWLWRTWETSSVVVAGPRRIGKTELLKVACRRAPEGLRAMHVDLQGYGTVEQACDQLEAALERAGLGEGGLARGLKKIEDVKVGPVGGSLRTEAPEEGWARFEALLRKGISRADDGELVVVALDEVPLWLDEVERLEGEGSARQALRSLNRIRAGLGRLRLALTGSIHVRTVAAAYDASEALQEQVAFDVGPLPAWGTHSLLEVELLNRSCKSVEEDASRRAHQETGGSPHWTKLVAALAHPEGEGLSSTLTAAALEAALERVLLDRHEEFKDYARGHCQRRHRPELCARLFAILDLVAAREEATPREAAVTAALAASRRPDRARAEVAVHVLISEYFLVEGADGLQFLTPLLATWWRRRASGS